METVQGPEVGSALGQRLNMIRRMTAVMKGLGSQVSIVKWGPPKVHVHGIYDGEYFISVSYR